MGRISLPASLAIVVVAVTLAVGGAATGSEAASRTPTVPSSATSYDVPGQLEAVVALSSANAWAAGYTTSGSTEKTLLLHWNGRKWSKVTSPAAVPGGLYAMTATSASNIWAVGYKITGPKGSHTAPLVLHFNGTSWREQTTGVPSSGVLYDVSTAGDTAWAVGGTSTYFNSSNGIIMHLVSGQWYVLPTYLSVGSTVYDVTATGPSTALALADDFKQGYVLLRWTGRGWTGLAAPKSIGDIENIGPGHSGTVWAVGIGDDGMSSMLWNGKSWQVEPKASFGSGSPLVNMVRPVPGGGEWAVGEVSPEKVDGYLTFAGYWNGKTWTQVPSPSGKMTSDPEANLAGVSAISKDNAWAVGRDGAGNTLILHWNGKAWQG